VGNKLTTLPNTGELFSLSRFQIHMRPVYIFAIIAFVSSGLPVPSSAESNQDAVGAAQMQRRMQEEQLTLEQKQAASPQDVAAETKPLDERAKLNAEQRRAQEQLQQRQRLLDAATRNVARTPSSPSTQINPTPLQNQLFDRERQQQDLSFDIQRQQLEFRQRARP
jgi:hypothetical protein